MIIDINRDNEMHDIIVYMYNLLCNLYKNYKKTSII